MSFTSTIPRKIMDSHLIEGKPWYGFPVWCSERLAYHTALLEYISSAFRHLPDHVDGFVQAIYAIGGEAPQFLHPNSPYFAQEPK